MKANDIAVFSDTYNLKSLIKKPTGHKNPNKPSCIDLILTNKPRSFQHSCVILRCLSDFHKMTITTMKKPHLRVVNYTDYKYFENDKFRTDLLLEFGKTNIAEKENGLNNLLNVCKRMLDIHAPRMRKYARSDQMLFMNQALSKAIMTRARLRNKFLKDRSEENKKKYSKQRSCFVSFLRKPKSDYFGNLNEKNINDNKTFWKTVKPFSSGKVR